MLDRAGGTHSRCTLARVRVAIGEALERRGGRAPLPLTGAQQKQRALSNWQRALRALQAPWSNWTDLAGYYTAEMPTPHTAAPSASALASAAPILDAAAASTITMPPDLRAQLHLEGFAVAKRCGRPVEVATLENSLYVSNSAFEPDGAITIRREEADRRTFSIRPPYLKELTQELRGDLVQHNLAGGRDLLEMRAIVSEPNGVAATTEQEVHCDDEDPEHEVYRKYYLADDVLLAGVCAVMPGTKMVLYPRGGHNLERGHFPRRLGYHAPTYQKICALRFIVRYVFLITDILVICA